MQEQDNIVNRLAHTKWNCKYHIVFAPKIYGVILNAKGADCVFRIIYLVATIRKGD